MTAYTRGVFLSHSSADKGLVKPILLALIDRKLPVFVDRPEEFGWGIGFCRDNGVSFLMGGDFGQQLRDAVRESGAILGCLSRSLANDRDVWKEELLVGEHLGKLVLCRIDDVSPAEFDDIETGTVQLERLQSRGVRLPPADPKDDVDPAVVQTLLSDAAFSFVLDEIETLCRAATASQVGAVAPAPPSPSPAAPAEAPRPPDPARVQISYPQDAAGTQATLPHVIKILADLGTNEEDRRDIADRPFEEIAWESFGAYLHGTAPTIRFWVRNRLEDDPEAGQLAVELTFRSLDDFAPSGIARQVPALSGMFELRTKLARLLPAIDGKREAQELLDKILMDPDLIRLIAEATRDQEDADGEVAPGGAASPADAITLDELQALIDHTFRPRSESAQYVNHEGIAALCQVVLMNSYLVGGRPLDTLRNSIAHLDDLMSRQIMEILHDESFQRIEGAWRGLHFLLQRAMTGPDLKVSVLNVSKRELREHLRDYPGPDWPRCPLLRTLHDTGYGTLGGEPPTCLVADYTFDHSSADVDLLRNLARIGAEIHAPVISGASPVLFNFEDWSELPNPSDLGRIVDQPEYAMWRSFRAQPEARFAVLTCPRFMARAPYGPDNPEGEIDFHEEIDDGRNWRFCWANGAYAMAANLARAFETTGWGARILGANAGGAIDGLPQVGIRNARGAVVAVCPTETPVSLGRERELAALGLATLVHQKNTPRAAFLSAPLLHEVPRYVDAEYERAERAANSLDRFLPVLRFVQHMRCILRDRAGQFPDAAAVENTLGTWLAGHVDTVERAPGEPGRTSRPLAAASLEVEMSVGPVRSVLVTVSITPRYQLSGEELPVLFQFHCPV